MAGAATSTPQLPPASTAVTETAESFTAGTAAAVTAGAEPWGKGTDDKTHRRRGVCAILLSSSLNGTKELQTIGHACKSCTRRSTRGREERENEKDHEQRSRASITKENRSKRTHAHAHIHARTHGRGKKPRLHISRRRHVAYPPILTHPSVCSVNVT